MPESKRSQRRLEAAERQRQALELRKAGASYSNIARQVGCKSPQAAYSAVESALLKTIQEPATAVRSLELERLDALFVSLWPEARLGARFRQADYEKVLGALTELARLGSGEAFQQKLEEFRTLVGRAWPQDADQSLRAIDRILRIMERRAKLLGLDAPIKQELAGPGGGPLRT